MAQFNEKSLMQGVYNKLLADGACEPALEIVLANKDKTVGEFFASGANNNIGAHHTRTAPWAYWVATQYCGKSVFPSKIIWACIESAISGNNPVSHARAIRLFLKAEKHLNKKERNTLRASFAGKMPRLEKKVKL